MKTLALPLLAALVVATGCGGEDEPPSAPAPQRQDAGMKTEADEGPAKPNRKGTTVTLGGSEFGEIRSTSTRTARRGALPQRGLNGGFWWVIGPDGRRRA
jgi:hypothetical protein